MLTDNLDAPLLLIVEDNDSVVSTALLHPDRVLVVDDEEMIREICLEMFRELGFEALAAAGGEEALCIFREQADRINLVLLDHSMPGMSGFVLFKELRKIRPDIPVLLASGYSEEEVTGSFKGLGLNGFIQKPFNLTRLSDTVRRVLNGC
jgi:two-component system cell cycle sensor histidine kinase/response regulator CckA